MKKLTLLLAAICCAVLANAQEFEIRLDIKGITSQKIYANVFGDKDLTHIDLDGKGTTGRTGDLFIIKGTTQVRNIIRIYFMEDRQLSKEANGGGYFPVQSAYLWAVIYPGARLEIKGDLSGKDYVDLYCRSDAENRSLADLTSHIFPLENEIGNLSVQLTYKDNYSKEELEKMEQKMETLKKQELDIKLAYLRQQPSSIAALWLMEDLLIHSEMEAQELEPLLQKVDAGYHSNYFYKVLTDRVQGARSAAVGAKCPSIKGTDQNGNAFDIKDIKDKYIIVDFWGTWCGACLSGVPHMKAFRDKHADKLQIVGIAQDRNVEKWKKCIADKGMDWPNILQGKGESDFVAKFNVQGYPTKILVGPDGTILYRESGENEDFYRKIEELMGE